MYYIYRYTDIDTIVYIGITQNLKTRLNQHKNDVWYKESLNYEFIRLPNKYIAGLYETYLINRDNPIYNISKKRNYNVELITFNIEENWINYNKEKLRLKSMYFKYDKESLIKRFTCTLLNEKENIDNIKITKTNRTIIVINSKELVELKYTPNYLTWIEIHKVDIFYVVIMELKNEYENNDILNRKYLQLLKQSLSIS